MQLHNLKQSITKMTYVEVCNLIEKIRNSRFVRKRPMKSSTVKALKKKSTVLSLTASLSDAEKLELLKMLGG